MLKKACSFIFSVCVIASMLIFPASAAEKRETISVYDHQVWYQTDAVTRTANYSFGYARAYAVWPLGGGTDNFHKIQTAIQTTGRNNISDVYVLDETETSNTKISIYEGKLSYKTIVFAFRGNSPNYGASAYVSYNPN